ncbi:O-phosphoseryl-tRNA(Cys) synthetase [Xanthomonas arboricola]|uniref:hypothetical protein n=1 Tax=Xanthomonas arboricola TaxID=56448 RepID=UPI0014311862|nr:hypothetical protein [Xanthomonas arboricola]NJC32290.1 O-phosphoseryl-tRNA(Cys) synthetase [Xanthomonas arboricola]
MAASAAVIAATKIPWKQVLMYLPDVAKAAKGIWKTFESKPKPSPVDPNASISAQIATIAQRINTVEVHQKSEAEVVAHIAEQLEGLALGLKETAARQAVAMKVSVGSAVVALSALAVALIT